VSLIRRAARRSETRYGVPPWDRSLVSQPSAAGVNVTIDNSMRHAAVMGCVRMIAGTAASLPLQATRESDGIHTPVDPVPPLLKSPSGVVPRSAWVFSAITSLLLDGNTYALVSQVDRRGHATQAEVLHPSVVSWRQVDGELTPFVDNVPEQVWPVGRLLHVPGWPMPGSRFGLSPISYQRLTIGTGLAAEDFGARFFGEGGHPTGILSTEQALTADQATELAERWNIQHRQQRKTAVLGAGMEYTQIQVNPSDSQFIETQRWTGQQVCMAFGVPPEMLGIATSGQSVTYANREQQMMGFFVLGLNPWLAKIEEALTSLLPGDQRVKFNTGAFLRSDLSARYASYSISAQVERMTGRPILTNDEIRALENLPPLPDDYEPLVPVDGNLNTEV
jgi:HK97 family phage portal protein